jgi:hypothetical protein
MTMADTNAPAVPQPIAPAPVPVTQPTNQADLNPQQRWQATQDERAAGDAWLDTTKILAKDEHGNLAQYERVVGADGQVTKGKRIDPVGPQDGDAPPADVPAGELFKFGDLELSESQIRDLVTHKAETDLRKALVPSDPGKYKLELPKDFALPVGADFKVADINDPVKGASLRAVQEWGFKNGLDQRQFSELLGLYVADQSRERAMIAKAAAAEREKLGPAGPSRVDAISTWLRGQFGETAARPMLNTLLTEAQCRIWESVITRFTNQGGANFSTRGREVESAKISDQEWSKLSYSEQKDYAERATARANTGARR